MDDPTTSSFDTDISESSPLVNPDNLLIECRSPYFPEMPETDPPAESTLTALAMSEAAWDAADGSFWKVAIIESCVSDNGNWYRGNVLKESAHVFENAPCRIYAYDGRQRRNGTYSQEHNDHMPGWLAARDAGSVTGNTVGVFRNVQLETIPSQRATGSLCEALTANLTFVDAATRNRIKEAWRLGLMTPNGRSLFELSIEASGPHKTTFHESGRQVRMVESIDSVREVTIVSEGAAGGRFLEMLKSPISESVQKTFPNSPQANPDFPPNFSPKDNALTEGPLPRLGPPRPVVPPSAPKDALPGSNYAAEQDVTDQSNNNDIAGNTDMIPQFGDDAVGQIQKATDVLRTGNQTLGIEILLNVLNEIKGQQQQPMANQPVNQVNQNPQILTKRESKKEPIKMPYTGEAVESEGQGSQYYAQQIAQEILAESRGYTDQDIADFARTVAERDSVRDQEAMELREALVQQSEVIEGLSMYLVQGEKKANVANCNGLLRARLRESGLPRATQTLIAEQYHNREFKESALLRTIDRHRVNTIQLAESFGREVGLREATQMPGQYNRGNVYSGRSAIDSIAAEIDVAFGYNPAIDSSLTESQRDVYKSIPRNPSIKRPLGIWHGDMDYAFNGEVGPNALLREAASTDAGLASLLQNSMTKSVMQRFMLLPAQYREVCEVVPAANFLEHQVIVTGGLGILPQVVESKTGVSYLTLGFPSNYQNKYTVGTFGGLIPVTRQAIINDNLQEIQEYPKRAAESAMMTLNLNVFGTLIGYYGRDASNVAVDGTVNAAVSYDGVPWYHVNHLNVTSTAMSYQELVNMQDRLFEQRTFGNTTTLASNITAGDATFTVTTAKNDFATGIKAGDKIQIEAEIVKVLSVSGYVVTITGTFASNHTAGPNTLPVFQLSTPIAFDKRMLIVPTQLSAKAYQLLASTLEPGTTTNSASALNPSYMEKSLRLLQLHSMYLQDDLNNYYMTAGKPIRWAFLGGRETPEVMLQDNPLVGNVFSGDLISWKVRHEHGGTMLSHLMVQAGLVT